MISNGPFTLTEWSINKVIKVTKNQSRDSDNLKLTNTLLPIDNESTADRYYRSETHNLNIIQTEKISKYKEEFPKETSLKNILAPITTE